MSIILFRWRQARVPGGPELVDIALQGIEVVDSGLRGGLVVHDISYDVGMVEPGGVPDLVEVDHECRPPGLADDVPTPDDYLRGLVETLDTDLGAGLDGDHGVPLGVIAVQGLATEGVGTKGEVGGAIEVDTQEFTSGDAVHEVYGGPEGLDVFGVATGPRRQDLGPLVARGQEQQWDQGLHLTMSAIS